MRSVFDNARRRVLAIVCLLTIAFGFSLIGPALAKAGNLLQGLRPSRTVGVSAAKVLTDGRRAPEGEDWSVTGAAVFQSERAFVEYDLGKSSHIAAAYLQGDNNDEYVVSVSGNHTDFTVLWTAGPSSQPGLRERFTGDLNGHGRWIRLAAHGGDRAYSATELQLFAERPQPLPPNLPQVAGESRPARVRSCLLYVVAGLGLFLFWSQAASSPHRILLGALPVAAAAWFAYEAIDGAWPLSAREVAFVRACTAAAALLAVLRRLVPGKRWPAHRGPVAATLGVTAIAAIAAFYNLGYPQFWDHAHRRPEFVHTDDMRVYQPFARHFKELQYDGVYLASVLAYAENQRGGSLDSLANQEVRGLRDHRVRRVREITAQIRDVRRRFTDQGWADLKQDMRYFEEVMGPGFLSTLTDHGANATPVWVFFARLLIGHWPASETVLTLGGLADAVLLGVMAVVLWRAFGLLPMLLAITVFGANDLYMFGTNWAGATLRHDWLALLGMGAAALKKERWVLAGVLLGLSAMIRAFPVAALLGVALPALWWLGERWRKDGRPPDFKTVLAEQPETARVLVSAAATVVIMFLITSMLYGFGSWLDWWHKVALLNRDAVVNEVSLRALVAGTDNSAGRALDARGLIFGAAWIGCAGWVVLLNRRRPLHQSMLLTMPLALVIWHPANYYSHLICMMALLASPAAGKSPATRETSGAEPPKTAPLIVPLHQVAIPLLALCLGSYWASLDPDPDRHFQESTVLLFVTLGWLYTNVSRRDRTLKPYFAG
jgi:hypothetical protein